MGNYLMRLAARSLGLLDIISPRSLSLFEPLPQNDDPISPEDYLSRDSVFRTVSSIDNNINRNNININDINRNDINRNALISDILKENDLGNDKLKDNGLRVNSLKENVLNDHASKDKILRDNEFSISSSLTETPEVHKSAFRHSMPKSSASAFSFLSFSRHINASVDSEKAPQFAPSIFSNRSFNEPKAKPYANEMNRSERASLSYSDIIPCSSPSICQVKNLKRNFRKYGPDAKINTSIEDNAYGPYDDDVSGTKNKRSAIRQRECPAARTSEDARPNIANQIGRTEISAESKSNDPAITDEKRSSNIYGAGIKPANAPDFGECQKPNDGTGHKPILHHFLSLSQNQASFATSLPESLINAFPETKKADAIAEKIDSRIEKIAFSQKIMPDNSDMLEAAHSVLSARRSEEMGGINRLEKAQLPSGDSEPPKDFQNHENAKDDFDLVQLAEIKMPSSAIRAVHALSAKKKTRSYREPERDNNLDYEIKPDSTSFFKSKDPFSLSREREFNEPALTPGKIQNISKKFYKINSIARFSNSHASSSQRRRYRPSSFQQKKSQRKSKPISEIELDSAMRKESIDDVIIAKTPHLIDLTSEELLVKSIPQKSIPSEGQFEETRPSRETSDKISLTKTIQPESQFEETRPSRETSDKINLLKHIQPEGQFEETRPSRETSDKISLTKTIQPEGQFDETRQSRETPDKISLTKTIQPEGQFDETSRSKETSDKINLLKHIQPESQSDETRQLRETSDKISLTKTIYLEDKFNQIHRSKRPSIKLVPAKPHQLFPEASVHASQKFESEYESQSKLKNTEPRRKSSFDRSLDHSFASSSQILKDSYPSSFHSRDLNPSNHKPFKGSSFNENKVTHNESTLDEANFTREPLSRSIQIRSNLSKANLSKTFFLNSSRSHAFPANQGTSRAILKHSDADNEIILKGLKLPAKKYENAPDSFKKISGIIPDSSSHKGSKIEIQDRSEGYAAFRRSDQKKIESTATSAPDLRRFIDQDDKPQPSRIIAIDSERHTILDSAGLPKARENGSESEAKSGRRGKVKIIIGRIDVHADMPTSSQKMQQGKRPKAQSSPRLSLDGYLKKRNEGEL